MPPSALKIELAPLAPFRMLLVSFLAAAIGLVAGVVAFALYKLIGLFTNLFFFHRWSADFSSAQTSADFCIGFGSLGRNIYRGPFQQNWDFSLIKHFKLGERQDIRFATDFFNLWNHPNFANPLVTDYEQYLLWASGSQTSPDPFGKIVNTTGTPRLIQFSLRWAF
jgi:hypothetical protein